jgi:hypothetical protein
MTEAPNNTFHAYKVGRADAPHFGREGMGEKGLGEKGQTHLREGEKRREGPSLRVSPHSGRCTRTARRELRLIHRSTPTGDAVLFFRQGKLDHRYYRVSEVMPPAAA